ncbi:MAG TPA: hypothetical protein VJ997_08395 [Longimicrobiales bacterium]|nr:hypothetical protein [Longimicrobiales bacterium]
MRYVLVVLLVATLPPAVIWWYLVHPFVDFWRRLGPRVALWIVGTSMVSLMVVLVLVRRRLVGADLGTSWPLFALGVASFGAGIFMGLKRRRYLTNRILSGVPRTRPG